MAPHERLLRETPPAENKLPPYLAASDSIASSCSARAARSASRAAMRDAWSAVPDDRDGGVTCARTASRQFITGTIAQVITQVGSKHGWRPKLSRHCCMQCMRGQRGAARLRHPPSMVASCATSRVGSWQLTAWRLWVTTYLRLRANPLNAWPCCGLLLLCNRACNYWLVAPGCSLPDLNVCPPVHHLWLDAQWQQHLLQMGLGAEVVHVRLDVGMTHDVSVAHLTSTTKYEYHLWGCRQRV